MKDVEIRNQYGKIIEILPVLDCSTAALKSHCQQYGQGIYTIKWKKGKHVPGSDSKPGKRVYQTHTKRIHIYGEPILYEGQEPIRRNGVIVMPRSTGPTNEDIKSMLEAATKNILDRVDERLSDLEEEEEEEEEEPSQSEIILNSIIDVGRSPKYAPIIDTIINSKDDEAAYQKIDAFINQNPQIIREAIFDVLEVLKSA